jgi:hypothetical protein
MRSEILTARIDKMTETTPIATTHIKMRLKMLGLGVTASCEEAGIGYAF